MLTSAIAMTLIISFIATMALLFAGRSWVDDEPQAFMVFTTVGLILMGLMIMKIIGYQVREEFRTQLQQQTEQVESNKREAIENE